jgi:hypothetical protein
MIHLLLKAGGFALSFPFADAAGELMTHEGRTFLDVVGKCVTGTPSHEPASQQLPHCQSKTNNTTTVQASKSDMIFGANVEWLSWFEAPRSPGGLRTGIAPPRAARGLPWRKKDLLRPASAKRAERQQHVFEMQ